MKKKNFLLITTFILIILIAISFFSDTLLKQLHNEKIWVHRVNSIERLFELKDKFYGVELDVFFLDSLNKFDVNHPPAKSIDLSLEKYLESVSDNKSLSFWLDFKNLKTENQENSLKHLNYLSNKFSIKRNNFIVESGNVSLLNLFSKNSYQVSYYIHWPGLYTLSNIKLKEKIKSLKKELNEHSYKKFLSSDFRDYKILRDNFPDYEILLWLNDDFGKKEKIKDRLQLYKMLNDKNVKVILTRVATKNMER